MYRKLAGAASVLVMAAPALAACGGTSPSGHGSASAGAHGSGKAAASESTFCARITRGGAGPADAFMQIELYSAKAAHKEALAESKLMQGATPPAAIAKDWATWKAYVQATLKASAHGQMASLAKKSDHARHAQKQLTDYAFAHCS